MSTENCKKSTNFIVFYRIMWENLILAHDNEKFYKASFCDGFKIILENLKNK